MNSKKNEISTRRSQLSPEKRAILEKRLQGECKSDNQQKSIPRRSQHNPVPLSFAQQRLWFLAELEPDSPFYNVPGVVRLQGKLNFSALQNSLQEIIQRHEALRCNFQTIEGKPVAFIAPTKTLLFPVFDISQLPENQQATEVENLAYQEAQLPFNLSNDLLLRVKLLRLNPEEHILLLTMHHIVSDGWSIGVLIQELATLYQTFCEGKISSLPELPIQYGDFATWQKEYLQREVLTAQKNYWKQQLGGSLPVLQLPTDYPRPAFQTYKGKKYRFTLSKSLTTALKTLSQQAEATLFMTLLAAFKTLIYRYSQEDDIIIGTAIANRNLPQIEKLIGFFVNTLVLRTDVSGNPSFLDLLKRVREVTLDAYNHQDLPFDQLVEEIQPERNLSHNPLFQVWFALNNSPMPSLEIGELTLSISEADSATAQFDFSLDMVEQQEQLIGTFEYNSDLFAADTITRTVEHFQTLLAGIIANPEQQISSLPLLTKAEENDLLWKWNNNQIEYPQEQCIHQLFENCANKKPNSISVVFQQQQLTYQELNSKANQLAHYLHSLGVTKNMLVGICVERSVEMIVALLGVLKAGGAYVPLDPAYPEERLSFMLRDSQVSVLLTQQKLVSSLPVENVPVVCLDRDWEIISQQSEVNPATNSTPDNLAYVIYTSGSTGKSKGVAIAHRSLVNAFFAWKKAYQLDCLTSHLQMASFAFDVFSGDLIRALCSGAKLVLCPREWLLEAENLYQLMLAEKVDSAEFVPVVLKNLVEYLERTQQNLHFMRLVVVGSDTLYIKEFQEFQRFCGEQTRLINSYGVTEATIDSTYFEVTQVNLSENALVPIGRPFANTEIYILDPYLQPVPVGIPGEIYIGGAGLARGYLNRPDLTTEKFILWNGEKRLYKTGDKAKYLADGNIEFLGRLDYQIKLRGFRIELGEIEAVIHEHPSVREATVISRKDISDNQQVVAYVVANTSDVVKEQTSAVDLNTQQTSQWQAVFDDLYNELDSKQQSGFYIKGWESSYTGLHIPDEEVHSWMNQTVERISALQPTRVLEIGSGSGLMLLRFAPHCRQYCATDISQNALNILQQQLSKLGQELSKVSFIQKGADDFTRMSTDTFDAVFIVSVAQYFPSVDYLLKVLEGAVDVVEPGGFIFLGDVRNFSLLEAFHTSVELHKAPDSLSVTILQQRVQKQIFAEKQLVIDPAFFLALKQHLPKISHIEIHLERGHFHNELTKFRYDVIIHIGHKIYPTVDISWLDWQQAKLTLPYVRQLLIETEPDILGIANVPNARVSLDVKAVELLKNSEGLTTVGELRQALQSMATTGVDPEEIWALSAELPYVVDISWSDNSVDGQYQVVFKKCIASQMQPIVVAPPCSGKTTSSQTWSNFANTPLQEIYHTQIVSQLRQHLEAKLPNYMMPSAFVMLDALPLTPNGKVDRNALPAPEVTQLLSESDFIAPSTTIEETLVNIWTEILGIDNIGVHYNFFNLGGHSLLATRVASQIRQIFHIEIPLRRIFEEPTIAGLAKDIEKATKANLGVEASSIERIERSQNLPLSFAQQRLWFLAELEPDSSSSNMPGAIRLQGQLNVEALQQSFNEILRRHEALRTNFQTIEGQPVAIILPPAALQLSLLDISELPANQQELQVKQQAAEEAQQPFDLNNGCLLRVKLLRLSEQEHVLFLTVHHIASDAWSIDILVREFATLYQAFCDEQPTPLAELPIQYVDFAAWQRQWLQGERLESQISYWRKQLEGVPKLLELPTDFPRPPVQSFRGATYGFELPQQLSVALNQLSQQQGSTLFMTLLAAFQTLLYRYTGSEDIAIGSPIGNRNRVEVESLIGLFVNILVLRTNLAGNPTFEELLTNVRSVALSAYAHQDLPFEMLVEELQPQRNLSHTPLFQVMFVLQNAPMSALELPSLTLSYLPIDNGTAKFDLTLDMTETVEGILGTFEYNTDLFQESTIKRMAGHLQTLLEGIVANPQQRLSELSLLTASEEHQLLCEWNSTEVIYSTDKCIHELFAAQVERTPDAVAVVYENQQLTYKELNAKANQLAHYLRSLGVKPEVLVGICVERSLDMAIGLLAILKAGGAYVPLDPNYPQERIAFILEDTQTSVLLTHQYLIEKLPEHKAQIVCLDIDSGIISQQNRDNPVNLSEINNLAYVIYTSGSTGKPKGVLGLHKGAINRFQWMWQNYSFREAEICCQKTSLNFVDSVWEIFGPLLQGITTIIVPDQVVKDPQQFVTNLARCNVTRLVLVPSLLRILLNTCDVLQLQLPKLKLWISSGEALSHDLLVQFRQSLPDSTLLNLYGSSEVSADVACYSITPQTPLSASVLIGRPIANTQVHILDANKQPVPVGVLGEIYIGGEQLARGYLNHPQLTAEKFIPNPFSEKLAARLYKTGDLARYLPNGDIEYIGRIDHQVKIRGFRIELPEIETIISQHPGVRETAVTVHSSETDSQRIVAYIVPKTEQTPTISELRGFLETKLPNYMIPAAFVTLETLPLTPNGKVDRKSLLAPDTARPQLDRELVAPRNFVETKLAEIWTEVLGVDKVGIFDNFFELGGDSIVAIVAIAKANKAGLQLTVKQLFQHQTVADLAAVAITKKVNQAEQEIIREDTSSNFPKANLNQQDLERFLAKVKRANINKTR
jgi:microcystin synthetase protein McyA